MIKESPRLGLTLENRFVAFGSQSTKSLWHCLAVDLGETKSQCLYWLKFCFYRFKMKAHRNEQKTKDKNYFKICITWISNEIVPNFDEQNSSHWMLKRKDSNTCPSASLVVSILSPWNTFTIELSDTCLQSTFSWVLQGEWDELFDALGFKAFSLPTIGATVETHVGCVGCERVCNFFGIVVLVRIEEAPPPQSTYSSSG